MAEHQYKEFSYAFTSKGLAARYAIDRVPDGMFWNHLGVEVRQEDALSTRLGRTPLSILGSTSFTNIAGAGASAFGGGSPWTNPGGVTSLVGSAATTTISSGTGLVSNLLQGTQYGFALPPTAVITGISITLTASSNDPSPVLTVQLMRSGVVVGISKTLGVNGTLQQYVLGGNGDLWSAIFGGSDFNISNSGFQLYATGANSGSVFDVLGVEITIFVSNANAPAPMADSDVHTLGRLKSINGNTYRYAGSGRNIYRITGDSPGLYVPVSAPNQLSGNYFSVATYRPNFSSYPYIFFADSLAMLKDNGTFNPLQQMGIFAPNVPAITSLGGAGNINQGAGSPYDYRFTYFNNITGSESNPSQVQTSTLSPSNQSINVVVTASLDPQVTNINVYRRGGTLNVGWTFVGQTTNTDHTYNDNLADASIASNNLLSLTNDVPLTTTLPVPVNTVSGATITAGTTVTITPGSMVGIFPNSVLTVDVGVAQELVVVMSTTATAFEAYFQNAHNGSVTPFPITASTRVGHPVNLMTIAFDIAWFAGDTDNPDRLYYSNIGNPETVPSTNWIEIGTPSDPIMAIVFFSGQLLVLTQSRIYRVIIPYPGAVPAPYPTASRHGLYANFAFAVSEGLIPYLSQDGVYIFQGANSNYASEVIEWLLANREPNLSPVPAALPQFLSLSFMAFAKNEFFLAIQSTDGVLRLIYDFRRSRWRNDDVQVTAMYFEEDTNNLVIGMNTGMVYIDRSGDFDITASGATFINLPINVNIQTGALDQQLPLNNKVYNELTLDVNCPDPFSVYLVFDSGTTIVSLGTFVTTGRERIPIPINAGVGQISQNVSLLITGTLAVTGPAHFFKWHIKAAIEAEYRDTFDSYWIKFGTDEFKIVKQGWFEYVAPAGITFVAYTEGDLLNPVFAFNLAATTVRTAKRVRFPATKGKVWRMIATSTAQFQLYGESFIEFKPVTMAKGYAKENLGSMITAQGSV